MDIFENRPILEYLHPHEFVTIIPEDNLPTENFGAFFFDIENASEKFNEIGRSSYFYSGRKIIQNYLNSGVSVMILPAKQVMYKGLNRAGCNTIQYMGQEVDLTDPLHPTNAFARRQAWLADFGTATMYVQSFLHKDPNDIVSVFAYEAIRPLVLFNINDASNLRVLLDKIQNNSYLEASVRDRMLTSIRMVTGYEATWEEQLAFYENMDVEARNKEPWERQGQLHFLIEDLLRKGVAEWRIGTQIYGTTRTALNRMSLYNHDRDLIDAITIAFPGLDGYYSNPVYSLFHGCFHGEICLSSYHGAMRRLRTDPYDACRMDPIRFKQWIETTFYRRDGPTFQQNLLTMRAKGGFSMPSGVPASLPKVDLQDLPQPAEKYTGAPDITKELVSALTLDDILRGSSSQDYNQRVELDSSRVC